jgi:thiamine biosynthesis lipoprotein
LFKKIIAIVLIASFALNVSACGTNQEKKRYEAQFLELFDTVTQIVAYSDSKEEFTKHSQLVYDTLKEYHQLYDIYNDYPGISNIKTINDNAGIKPVKVDKKIIDLLLFAKKWYKDTDGNLNVALGAVLKIWHKHREEGIEDEARATLPDIAELKEASKHTDINKVIIDQANSTVFLEDPEMSLDVGGVGKGYATEQVCLNAIKNGFTSGLISVGGNVRAIGGKGTSENMWNVGVQNPDKESQNKTLKVANLNDMSLVSSGIYERYYIVAGKQYHHIIDPVTLFPADNYAQVTILCKDSGVADAMAKAAFILPFDKALKYINGYPDVEAMWVFKDGAIKYSDGFENYLKK